MPRVAMVPAGAFGWRAEVPAELAREGLVEYAVAVYQEGKGKTYPGGDDGDPYAWDFTGRDYWSVPVVADRAPILLFDAMRDLGNVLYPHPWDYVRFRTDVPGGSEPGRLALAAVVETFAPAPHHFALRTFLPEAERTRLAAVGSDALLHVRARAAGGPVGRIEVTLVERDGTAWGTVLDLTDEWREYVVPVSALLRGPLALLPRPYPQFLPYLFESAADPAAPDPAALDGLQFSVSAELFGDAGADGSHGFEVERVVLDPGTSP